MFKTILCAVDGSDRAERALALAGTLAADGNATLDVVHVVEYLGTGRVAGVMVRPEEPEIRAWIAAQTATLTARGVRCRTHLPHGVEGQTARRLAELARELGADLIVLATRGHTGLTGVIFGSVAQRLLHEASCPVLTVPPLREPVPDRETVPMRFAPATAFTG